MNAPDFLVPPTSLRSSNPDDRSKAVAALEIQTWEIAFETILERLAAGVPFDVICREYHQPLQPARLRTWIHRNEKRRNAYHAAKAVGAEAIEDELIRIADGLDANGNASLVEVPRSQLQIQTRKWLLQVWNRKRYGDVKHIEQTTTSKLDVSTMTTDDLKRFVLQQAGLSADDAEFGELFEHDDSQDESAAA